MTYPGHTLASAGAESRGSPKCLYPREETQQGWLTQTRRICPSIDMPHFSDLTVINSAVPKSSQPNFSFPLRDQHRRVGRQGPVLSNTKKGSVLRGGISHPRVIRPRAKLYPYGVPAFHATSPASQVTALAGSICTDSERVSGLLFPKLIFT